MSHFSVMVVGENVEEQLAPYHEFECTGEDDQYIQNLDETEEYRNNYEKYKEDGQSFAEYCESDGKALVRFGEVPDTSDAHKYGYTLLSENGDVLQVIQRTNPNKKWDYWRVGGRWAGFLKLKPAIAAEYADTKPNFGWEFDFNSHGKNRKRDITEQLAVDSALKAHVDWEGMMRSAEGKADQKWARFQSKFGHFPKHESWESVRDIKHLDDSKAAYWSQPLLVAWRTARDKAEDAVLFDSPFADPDQFLVSREQYILTAKLGAIRTFAFVRDSKWAEKGNMGWWGCVSNEKDSWPDIFWKLLQDVPDTERLTVVDCHI